VDGGSGVAGHAGDWGGSTDVSRRMAPAR
jgi:hypothetical protein